MVSIIYVVFLLLMLVVLFFSGQKLRTKRIGLIHGGFWGIMIYTLNEGLRYGRGIDYNLYGQSYEDFLAGADFDYEIGFLTIAKFFASIGVSWQGFVIFMSFVFIVSVVFLLRNFKEVIPYALPLFALLSMPQVENMVRWYLAFSFVLIGLSYQLQEMDKLSIKFVLFSLFACTFHLAIFPLAIAFGGVLLIKRTLLSPIWVIILFFSIALFFQTDFMLQFIDIINALSATSERFAGYGNRAEYWLTGGYAGGARTSLPNIQEVLFLCFIVITGYRVVSKLGRKYIFAYNLFIIGFVFYPIARQIELVARFVQPFLFFRAIVLACILQYVFVKKRVRIQPILYVLTLFVFLNMGRKIIVAPFKVSSEHYLYVWDRDNKSYSQMYDIWINDMQN